MQSESVTGVIQL